MKWMADAATAVGLKVNPAYLQLNPDPTGPQHDETKSSVFKFAGKLVRKADPKCPLHPSVLDRFQAPSVLHYDEIKQYRPENLRNHERVKHLYDTSAAPVAKPTANTTSG
jgi:hypothetical protein